VSSKRVCIDERAQAGAQIDQSIIGSASSQCLFPVYVYAEFLRGTHWA